MRQKNKPWQDLYVQFDYLWSELGGYGSTLKKMEGQSINDAVVTFETDFERSGDTGSYPERRSLANAVLTKFGGTAVSSVDAGNTGGSCESSTSGVTGDCPVTAPKYGLTSEYGESQLASLFGNPGTESSHPGIKLTKVNFNGKSVQINEKAAGCLKAVAADIKAQNISYTVKEMGCYRFDSNNGSSNIGLKSYHTYGGSV